jgi:cell pole-organizing protein PopZ
MAEPRDPSVEDILASIKRVLAEDAPRSVPLRAAPATAAPADPPSPAPTAGEVLELTAVAEAPAAQHPEAEADEEAEPETTPLVDDAKARSMRASLDALATLAEPGVAPQIVRSGETSLEQLTRDLMRPMLKAWLDTNLPPLVEAMVAREIERIARKQ